MGNRPISQKQFNQLDFYALTDYKDFGQCQVYSLNKFPSSYVIKIVSELSETSLLELFSQIENDQNIYLLGLYGFRNGKLCQCSYENLVSQSLISFWEYLSFSLKDAIVQRKSVGRRFQQSQIWHIIKACIHGYQTFQKLKICFDFSSSKLLINQEGRIRLDWMHIKHKNQHSIFLSKLLNENWEIRSEQYLAPQQLQALYLKQFTTKIDFEKTNIFSLGMLLLECLTLTDPSQAYYSQGKVDYYAIQKHMSTACSTYYSQKLLHLVGSMLRVFPKQRLSFAQVKSSYNRFLSPDNRMSIMKNQLTETTSREYPQLYSFRN